MIIENKLATRRRRPSHGLSTTPRACLHPSTYVIDFFLKCCGHAPLLYISKYSTRQPTKTQKKKTPTTMCPSPTHTSQQDSIHFYKSGTFKKKYRAEGGGPSTTEKENAVPSWKDQSVVSSEGLPPSRGCGPMHRTREASVRHGQTTTRITTRFHRRQNKSSCEEERHYGPAPLCLRRCALGHRYVAAERTTTR